jgi:hypothetical protein
MSKRRSSVTGKGRGSHRPENIPNRGTPKHAGPAKPVQSTTRHGRPVQAPEASDAGCLGFLVALIKILPFR